MLEIVTIWECVINSDGTEGRGHDVVIARFFTETAAKSYVKGKDVMGSDGNVYWAEALRDDGGNYRILGPIVDVANNETDIKRQKALKKLNAALTREERELLGILDS
jgi:hypothetical protein